MTPSTALERVRSFANTVDLEDGSDRLSSIPGLSAWLGEHGLDGPVGEEDLALARRARDGIRALIHVTHDEPRPRDERDIAALDDVVDAAGLAPSFSTHGVRLAARADGVPGTLGDLLAVVDEAMADGTWQRLKLCDDEGCRWAFYDQSRNRSGRWCDMAVCGNRNKARSYRERHAT